MANEQAIRNTRGILLATIEQGKTDSDSTSLVLHGYGADEYGQLRDQTLVHLLENFYGSSGPSNPIQGQLWFRANDQLYVWVGSPGSWSSIVPPADALGFNIIAGAGLTGGGFPTLSPAEVILNVGAGTGIRVGSPAGYITVKESEIDHDNLSNYIANKHINHASVTLTAGSGLIGGGDITASQDFEVGEGDGIQVNADNVQVDNTVVLISGSPANQTVGGIKLWTNQLRGDGDEADPSIAVAFTFTNDTDTGVLRTGVNTLAFATSGLAQFEIRSTGVLRARAGSPLYENKISHDDDIPNKAYVDALAGPGVSPTENTIVGTSTITGMTADKKYLVNIYSVIPNKGNLTFTLDAIVIRTGVSLGSGTILATTNSVSINWPDGNAPTSCSFIVDLTASGSPSATSINCQVNDTSTGGGDVYSSYMTAVQLN